jgi:hypothetical protein
MMYSLSVLSDIVASTGHDLEPRSSPQFAVANTVSQLHINIIFRSMPASLNMKFPINILFAI